MLQHLDRKFWELLEETSISWVLLIGVIIVAAVLIVRIKARYCGRADSEADPHQLLMQMGEMHREGELSEEEFRSIKGRLLSRTNNSTGKL